MNKIPGSASRPGDGAAVWEIDDAEPHLDQAGFGLVAAYPAAVLPPGDLNLTVSLAPVIDATTSDPGTSVPLFAAAASSVVRVPVFGDQSVGRVRLRF